MEETECEAWEKIIRSCLIAGRVVISSHALKRMGSRGYTTEDVLCILEYGKITEIMNNRKERCRCRVEGRDTEGDQGSVIAELISDKKLIVVTVLGGS